MPAADFLQRREVRLGAAAGLAVIVLVGIVLLASMDAGEAAGYDEYASANQSGATTDALGGEVAATVNITDYGVSPVRVEIAVGEVVRFRNVGDAAVELSLDRSDETPTIGPGESVRLRFRAITDYQVADAESGDLIGRGSVYVE